MTLPTRHDARRLDGPPCLTRVALTPHQALAEVRWLEGARTEDFVFRFLPLRDELAWRAARLEPLTATERAVLVLLDSLLDELDRRAEPLPDDVKQIIADVLRDR